VSHAAAPAFQKRFYLDILMAECGERLPKAYFFPETLNFDDPPRRGDLKSDLIMSD